MQTHSDDHCRSLRAAPTPMCVGTFARGGHSGPQCLFRVISYRSPGSPATSAPGGIADEIRAKADFGTGMSESGGTAVALECEPEPPLVSKRRLTRNSPAEISIQELPSSQKAQHWKGMRNVHAKPHRSRLRGDLGSLAATFPQLRSTCLRPRRLAAGRATAVSLT